MSELKRYYAPHVLPERRYHDETEVVLAADHEAEITKLKEKLEAVYDAGMWGIEHVAMANYAHRELEAKQKLREAAK